ncbi:MAG: hypothetical protein ACRDI0_05305 [Actinomycetota bacterium]
MPDTPRRRGGRSPGGRGRASDDEPPDLDEENEEPPIPLGSETVTEPPEAVEGPPERRAVREEELPLSVHERREVTRGLLAMALLGLLGVLVVAGPVLVATGRLSTDQIEVLAQVILTPLVGLVGSVIGFYFGGLAARSDEEVRQASVPPVPPAGRKRRRRQR